MQAARGANPRRRRLWLGATLACATSYLAVQWLGNGQWRSEFLGASTSLALLAFMAWAAARFAQVKGHAWPTVHAVSLFFLNWGFAAALMAALAW